MTKGKILANECRFEKNLLETNVKVGVRTLSKKRIFMGSFNFHTKVIHTYIYRWYEEKVKCRKGISIPIARIYAVILTLLRNIANIYFSHYHLIKLRKRVHANQVFRSSFT